MTAYYVVVRGPLGAGKTTVTAALAPRLEADVVSIDLLLDTFPWDGGSEELFLRANGIAVEQARAAFERDRPVIFDGNFYWSSALSDLEASLSVQHRVVRLDVPLAVCIARDRERATPHGEEATRAVFEKVARVQAGVPIDGTRPVPEIAEAILAEIPSAWRVAPGSADGR